MKKITLSCLFLLVVFSADLRACGYNFVGGCSSLIHLKINGTEGIFAIDPCNAEPLFQGLQLGNLRNLNLSGGSVITWESCTNNVTAAAIYYRIYPTAGQPGGSWLNLNVPEDYFTVEGPYTTRYRIANSNVNLTNGLSVGTNYTMEVYVRAEIDTLGDDFIPETFILKNNGGANYKLGFTYGGPTAPALTTVVTRKEAVKCWGGNTGLLGVTTFGGQPGGSLFYQWSAFTENFFQIDSLPAATYTVTVTETPTGFTSTRSAQITQPQLPISLSFSNVTPAACAMPGAATINPMGGTAPFSWEWSNGDTTQTAHFATSGTYAITVVDANACVQKGMLNIGGTGTVTLFELHSICSGETFQRGNQTFTQQGLYSVNIPAPNGCDSVIQFFLTVVENSNFLSGIPAEEMVTCAAPLKEICAQTGATAYEWLRNDQSYGNAACINVSAAGNYSIKVTNITGDKTCVSSKAFSVTEHLFPAPVGISTDADLLPPCGTGGVLIVAVSNAAEPIATYQWTYNNNPVSTNDTCSFLIPPPVGTIGALILQTTDIYGCTKTTPATFVLAQPNALIITGASQKTNCDGTVEVSVNAAGGTPPFSYEWASGQTSNPADLSPGVNNFTLTDAIGCAGSVFVVVEDFNLGQITTPATGANKADGAATVLIKGAVNLPYKVLWSNGVTTTSNTNLLPGSYCATVTDAALCTREICADIEYPNSTTQPLEQNHSLLVIPNPATAGGAINVPARPTESVWELLDLTGKIQDRQVLNPNQTTLQLPSKLPEGLYIALVRSDKYLTLGKIFLKNGR